MKTLLPLAFVATLELCFSGCSARPVPSDDSRYLTKVVVPKLTDWANGSEPFLDLSKNALTRDYGHICFVGEYSSLNIIERNLGFKITDHHSDFGKYVPESKWAIVAVKHGEAHAALGDGLKVNLDLPPGRLCAPAQRARLIRVASDKVTIPTVGLETSGANNSRNRDGVQ